MQRTLNKPLIFLATVASLSIVGALSTHSLAQGRQAQQAQGKIVPTYYVDIKPILEKNCTSCHVIGGIAPFALDNPTDAVKWADSIAQVTKSGYMPPWPPSKDGEPFLYERRLGAASKQVLEDWAKAKAPLGKAPRK
jgi:mono/diheme cytochrome c family protein